MKLGSRMTAASNDPTGSLNILVTSSANRNLVPKATYASPF